MKLIVSLLALFALLTFTACGGSDTPAETGDTPAPKSMVKQEPEMDPMTNKGIGPVTSLTLPETIDQEMVAKGEKIYGEMCSACHKANEKFIGPAPAGILKRRTPEWIMNMILNPTEMTQKDPIAKQLLKEANGAPMANQNLTEEQARAILEYFRTL